MRKRFLLAALVLPLAALGQDKAASSEAKLETKSEAKVEYEKKTIINFDDDTIQGDLTRPDGEYVEARKRVNHSNLIKIREEWRDKVKQAAAEM
ncbi:MAG: hypothetical protein A2V77_13320 [Anaeromyxobacter sp. RBG_16_69_14]|nr:MAG: hypothetical protein A2V77_13320 [Anaeromyxobacter sp. RBG_16_69_14]